MNFVSGKDLEEEREMRREARATILEKAKRDFEKRQAREDLAKLRGEDKWMLPELSTKLEKSKDKKKKKKDKKEKKKNKKDKKLKKKKKKVSSSDSSSSSEDEDEWVEKKSGVSVKEEENAPVQRDEWMSFASILPTFSTKDLHAKKRTSMVSEEESARKLMMDRPGQNSRELNPYWKNGGNGLPPEKDSSETQTTSRNWRRSSRSRSRSRSPRRTSGVEGHNRGNRSRSKSKSRSPSRRQERAQRLPQSKNRFQRPGDEEEGRSVGSSAPVRRYTSSQPGWKKTADKPLRPQESSSSSDSSSEDNEEPKAASSATSDTNRTVEEKPAKILSEQELNALNAKIIKAEIMGNDELVATLKKTLAEARHQTERMKTEQGGAKEKVVTLTRSDGRGGHHPLPAPRYGEQSLQGSKGKGRKNRAETHQGGQRVRYFADDDKYSLNEMFQREKLNTAEDQNSMMSRLAGQRIEQTNDDFDVDDMFESRAQRGVDSVAAEARDRQRAIRDHEKREKILDSCAYCFDSPAMQKHLIIAIGVKCYLSLPMHQSLAEGHCLIVPRSHVTCATQLDEDVWAEMMVFRKALTRMFEAQESDAIFFETAMNLKRFPHMVLECVPLAVSAGETAPIYFKKALLECESEWSMNKKVIDLKGRDVRKGVPKGLPYFSVDFGVQSGFAHIIEDEQRFPTYFAQEVLGGILDVEPQRWRRPRRENFDQQRQKVLDFAAMWKPHDFTAKLSDA